MLIIEQIRYATKPMHEELDAAMMPHIKSIRSADDYIQLLLAFYGFFQPVYEQINAHLETSLLPDYATRRKPDDILKNLSLLAFHQSVLKRCIHLPNIINNTSAFGALYVLEGSTLGGLMIKKMIAEQTQMSDEQLSFFAGYGKQTREKWDVFIETLNGVAKDESEEQILMAAAAETFICFSEWMNTMYF